MNARSHPRPIRMSGAGHCPRRQAYQSLGYPPSNPPDAAGRNRMALGDACETLIIHGLLDDGWTVQHTQATPGSAQLEIVRRHPPMTGHPDGVCRHPDITGGSRLTLEAKSMSPELLDRVIFEGIENVYPEYLDQAAIYSHHLYAHQLIDEPDCAVFATMDREGRPGPPQLVRWPEQHVPQALERLELTWETIRRGELPPRPYEAGNNHCRHCPFRIECHGVATRADRARTFVDAPQLEQAGEDWLRGTALRNQARDKLLELCPDYSHPGVAAGPVLASWFIPDQEPRYDTNVLARYLTPEQISQARMPAEPTQAFWIRADQRGEQAMPQADATQPDQEEKPRPDEPQDLAYQVCSEFLSEASRILDACEAETNPWAARYHFDALKPIVAEIGRQINRLPDPAERDTCQRIYEGVINKGIRIRPSIPMICQSCDEPFAFDPDNPDAPNCGRASCNQ